MRKVAVILGAGASLDAWNGTGPPANPTWAPPLAKDLFGARDIFWRVLETYRGAQVLASDLGELVRRGLNIEQKLREYSEHRDGRVRNHFKHVPPYLRDLLNTVVREYTGEHPPGTHLRFLMKLLTSNLQLAFVVLNYDDYVELSLSAFDERLRIRTMDDYVAPGRPALVGKVHGSVDWGRPMEDKGNWEASVLTLDLSKRPSQILLEQSRSRSREWFTQDRKQMLYPVLTAPLAGKGHTDLVCPAEHLDALREFLSDCRDLLVIGTSGQDDDLAALLASCLSEVKIAHYVNGDRQAAEQVHDRFSARVPAFRSASTVFYDEGFRAYTGSEELDAFLAGNT